MSQRKILTAGADPRLSSGTAELVARARSRISAMKIAPCSGVVSSQQAAKELEQALDALSRDVAATPSIAEKALGEIHAQCDKLGKRSNETLMDFIHRLSLVTPESAVLAALHVARERQREGVGR